MPTFKNLNEFYSIIENPTKIAIDYVCDKILTELDLQIASKGIGLGNNTIYEPTGDFYEAWKQDITTRVGDFFANSISYDSSNMTVDPDNFIHGSNYWEYGDDIREIMPEIIFGGRSGGLFGQGFWTKERDAWTPTMNRLNKSFNRWIIEGFKFAGFNIKKGVF